MISKFTKSSIQYLILLVFFSVALILYILRMILIILEKNLSLTDFLILTLFILLFIMLVLIIKEYKKIRSDEINKTVIFYSIFFPFGKKIELQNFSHKIIINEITQIEKYEVLYLINNTGYAIFKINGKIYKNFNEINESIDLELLDFKPNAKMYFRLLYWGKAKIDINRMKTKNMSSGIDYETLLTNLFFISTALFTVGYLIKIIIQLFN
jgi:hypothetical protein